MSVETAELRVEAECDGDGGNEIFTDETATGDAAYSLLGDAAFVDSCTPLVCDSPAS